ncbi:uncharacterized protein HD556DRAFT_1311777 [Suillus plorans]|uniref:F-box domain-containing protein n=1 Tax=Suillus plorans TaxID=116603 RepID=A0A9P7DDU5_9AGAM|nr:uncharacterized protein HD556DRAFT_1311777 [Suillus plorans]KAG1788860.1 hypothetical protein HD556DRAFT_1311777 [Suillus plorans]
MTHRVPQPCYIRKLPVEILSKIFMLAVHGTSRKFFRSVMMMPHALASVNLHWRTVAICNHSLWSSLIIDLHQVIRNQTDGGLTLLTTMITRSGRSSVDIIIRAQQGRMSATEEMIALQILNERRTEGSSALRLESIKLVRTNDYLSRFWLFCPGIMKMVDGFMFAALIGPTSQDAPAQSPPLPKLRDITLYGVHLDWTNFLHYTLGPTPNRSPTVSHSIQSLELSHHSGEVRPTSDEFTGILEACPRLRKLVLRKSGPLAGLSRRVSLPLLQQLYYGYSCIGNDVGLFSGLHAPNLIKLTLNSESSNLSGITYSPTQNDGEDDKADDILKYCATHLLFPRLQELSCYHINAPVNTFTLFMNAIPTLLHLSLYGTPNAIPALLPIQNLPCPALESIYMSSNLHKDSLIGTLKERSKLSKGASKFAEWQYEEMWEDDITVFFG